MIITRIKFLVHGMGQHCFKPKKQFVFANDYGRTNWFRVIFHHQLKMMSRSYIVFKKSAALKSLLTLLFALREIYNIF